MTVTVRDYPVVDQPTFPKPGPAYRASLDFTLRWTALGEVVNLFAAEVKVQTRIPAGEMPAQLYGAHTERPIRSSP